MQRNEKGDVTKPNKRSRKSKQPRRNIGLIRGTNLQKLDLNAKLTDDVSKHKGEDESACCGKDKIKEEEMEDYEVADWFNYGPSLHREGHSPPGLEANYIKSSPDNSDTECLDPNGTKKFNKDTSNDQSFEKLKQNQENKVHVNNSGVKTDSDIINEKENLNNFTKPSSKPLNETSCSQENALVSVCSYVESSITHNIEDKTHTNKSAFYKNIPEVIDKTDCSILSHSSNKSALENINVKAVPNISHSLLRPFPNATIFYCQNPLFASTYPAQYSSLLNSPNVVYMSQPMETISNVSHLPFLGVNPIFHVNQSGTPISANEPFQVQSNVSTPVTPPHYTDLIYNSRSNFDLWSSDLRNQATNQTWSNQPILPQLPQADFPSTHKVNLDVPFSGDASLHLPILKHINTPNSKNISKHCNSSHLVQENIDSQNYVAENSRGVTTNDTTNRHHYEKRLNLSVAGYHDLPTVVSHVANCDGHFEKSLADTTCTWSVPNATPKMSLVEIQMTESTGTTHTEDKINDQNNLCHIVDIHDQNVDNPLYTLATTALSQGEINSSHRPWKRTMDSQRSEFLDPTKLKFGVDDNDFDKEDELDDMAKETDDEWIPQMEERKRNDGIFSSTESDTKLVINDCEEESVPKISNTKSSTHKGRGRPQIQPVRCAECGKIFRGQYHLKRHQLSHTETRLFRCEICDKRFKQKSHLKGHMEIHNKTIKPSFVRTRRPSQKENEKQASRRLGRPKKSYTEGDLSCLKCGKVFKTIYRLKVSLIYFLKSLLTDWLFHFYFEQKKISSPFRYVTVMSIIQTSITIVVEILSTYLNLCRAY